MIFPDDVKKWERQAADLIAEIRRRPAARQGPLLVEYGRLNNLIAQAKAQVEAREAERRNWYRAYFREAKRKKERVKVQRSATGNVFVVDVSSAKKPPRR